MWKLIEVAEAPPLIVFPAARTCLMSSTDESFAPTVTVVAKLTSFRDIVKDPVDPEVFVTTMLVTTAMVLAGTVYKVVDVVVVAAPRNKTLGVVGIIPPYIFYQAKERPLLAVLLVNLLLKLRILL
jgi:hypothetical protein